MPETPFNLLLFWAKTSPDKTTTTAYHPLLCHLIDVAAVTQAIWDKVLPTATKRRIAAAFDATDLAKIGDLVAFIAGLHDLGKCSPPFALRGRNESESDLLRLLDKSTGENFATAERLRGKLQTIKLLELYDGTPFAMSSVKPAKEAPHGYVTAVELPRILETEFKFPRQLARGLATMIGGHHGIFPTAQKLNSLENEASRGNQHWQDARQALTLQLADLLQIPCDWQHLENKPLDNATTMILAGLISVADWLGSDTQFFGCRIADFRQLPEIDLGEYLAHAAGQANQALRQLGWLDWAESKVPAEFGELFPFPPRGLQQVAIEIANELKTAGIVVVESPMGEGKTEAAMFLADTWNANLEQRGIYFALPTQATSNQMFGRVEAFLTNRFATGNIHLQLQHGHASLSGEFATLKDNFKNLQGISDDECADGQCVPNVVAAEWFTYRKRGLLAPFGVGTIDQALMAVLQTKHVFVRLFGLAHKTIIIDEVHAYDAYMSTLLERLLEWLAALGSPVVLLSATLPKRRRNALIQAYQRGLGKTSEIAATSGEDVYPRISYALDEKIQVRKIGVSEKTQTLHLEKVAENFIANLKAKLADGGCVAIICNTVKRSQDLYQLLSQDEFFQGAASDGQPKLDLLHARFRYLDRKLREERCLQRFGKPHEDGTSPHRPHCAVLISTQIIEQSLDLDFDLLISDLAPLDLLLQRAGRLHRHRRARPANLAIPMLWIVETELANETPDFAVNRFVYDAHILLRTWLKLKEIGKIEIPGDIEQLVEAVYDEENKPVNLGCEIEDYWHKTCTEYLQGLAKEESEAENRWIKRPGYSGHLGKIFADNLAEDAPEAHKSLQAVTRLTEPTVTIICLWAKGVKIYLDEQFTRQIDLSKKPSLETTKELLKCSVGVSNKGVVFKFWAEEVPLGWRNSALLRNHRVVLFDENRNCEKFSYTFRLDENLGLQITKKEN